MTRISMIYPCQYNFILFFIKHVADGTICQRNVYVYIMIMLMSINCSTDFQNNSIFIIILKIDCNTIFQMISQFCDSFHWHYIGIVTLNV